MSSIPKGPKVDIHPEDPHLYQTDQVWTSSESLCWAEWSHNHLDDGRGPNKVPAWGDPMAQRTVHSTSEHDGIAGVHERKHNRCHTRSSSQSNPDTDMCQRFVGNLSTMPWKAEIRVGEFQWECYVFDWDTLWGTRSASADPCLIKRNLHEQLYAPFQQFWNAWVFGPCRNYHCWALVLQETMLVFSKEICCVREQVRVANPWPEHVWFFSLVGFEWSWLQIGQVLIWSFWSLALNDWCMQECGRKAEGR